MQTNSFYLSLSSRTLKQHHLGAASLTDSRTDSRTDSDQRFPYHHATCLQSTQNMSLPAPNLSAPNMRSVATRLGVCWPKVSTTSWSFLSFWVILLDKMSSSDHGLTVSLFTNHLENTICVRVCSEVSWVDYECYKEKMERFETVRIGFVNCHLFHINQVDDNKRTEGKRVNRKSLTLRVALVSILESKAWHLQCESA